MSSIYNAVTGVLSPVLQTRSNFIFAVLGFGAPFVLTFVVTTLISSLRINNKPTVQGITAPLLPYSIPYIGNLFQFILNPKKVLTYLTKNYNGIPVQLTLGPEKVYIVSGAHNIQSIFNRSKDVSTKALTLMVMKAAFGLPDNDLKVYTADDSGLLIKPNPGSTVKPEHRIFHRTHHGYTAWLTGAGLAELSKQFIRNLQLRIDIKTTSLSDTWDELPDIFEYVQTETFISTTTALCGEHFLRLNPTFIQDFWAFDHNLVKLVKHIPRWLAPKAYAARARALESVARWHEWARSQIDPASETLRDVLWEPVWGAAMMRGRAAIFDGMSGHSAMGHASSDLGAIWAANANVIPAAGWSLLHVLADKNLNARIQAEIEPCFSSKSPDSIDITKLQACPLLNSVVSEVLRLRIAMFVNRTSVIDDMKLGKWVLKKGQMILSNIYFSHRDVTIWNQGALLPTGEYEHPLDSFWAERFLIYPNDPLSGPLKSSHTTNTSKTTPHIQHNDAEAKYSLDGLKGVYIPFGGGTNMCPGRHYAKNEMLLVVAMVLWAFEFEMVDQGSFERTRPDMRRFPSGTLSPDRKNAVMIRVRRWE